MLRNLPNGKPKWLLPLSFLYGGILKFRNYLYNHGIKTTYQSNIFTIGIGNLTVGGTGKTPHIEYLIQCLQSKYTVAILSRGYGRTTKGFLQATATTDAQQIGDEPMQIFAKWGTQVKVFVSEKRAIGLQKIEQFLPKIDVVLLDDVFQHRAVKPHINILLTDFKRLFYEDNVLPAGLLRESKKGANRADIVIVTKCPPDLEKAHKTLIEQNIAVFTKPDTPIYFSRFRYGTPKHYFASDYEVVDTQTFWLVSGIAQPKLFEEEAKKLFLIAGHTIFADHHRFDENEVNKLITIARTYPILTTEKDYIKIKPIIEKFSTQTLPFFFLPIEVDFGGDEFDNFILSKLYERNA